MPCQRVGGKALSILHLPLLKRRLQSLGLHVQFYCLLLLVPLVVGFIEQLSVFGRIRGSSLLLETAIDCNRLQGQFTERQLPCIAVVALRSKA